MTTNAFQARLDELTRVHNDLIQPQQTIPEASRWFQRYGNPVLTASHAPLFWRYDRDPDVVAAPADGGGEVDVDVRLR
ncbi:MAG: hypothetical protein ABSG65_22600 [Bryobacteraceae bacterium]|jgi:4-O-beta-D-mannosyl-D-glucose phosphorylase